MSNYDDIARLIGRVRTRWRAQHMCHAAVRVALYAVAAVGVALVAATWILDATALTLFPARVTLDVTPGHARVKAGDRLTVQARLVGNRAPVIAQFQVADGDRWRSADMLSDKSGAFALALEAVTAPFKYRVVAGTVTSPTYDVSVAHAPRVSRIHLLSTL